MWLLHARNFSAKFVKKLYQPSLPELITKISENNVSVKYEEALKNFQDRILFNSVLEIQTVRMKKYDEIIGKREKREIYKQFQELKTLPVVLSQFVDDSAETSQQENDEYEDDDDLDESLEISDLPYARYLKVEASENTSEKEQIPKNWLQDYELYNEAEEELESTYGTPNPKIPVSIVPCCGCGAHLHCKDTSIPGYIPSELFVGLKRDELKTVHCQRCHFLVNYNTAIDVTVKPDDYVSIISSIKNKIALAVILVDLLDFPCSIYPDIKELLGTKRPIIIVGNKVDLIPRDHPNYLNHIKDCLKKEAVRMGFEEKQIKHISLISAKTNYGIEQLITKIHGIWRFKGDIYLIGCTNVGKSSLFNALLASDLCKVEASDLMQRATTCPWPGTTLQMLKFPIQRVNDYHLALRTQRLITESKAKFQEDVARRTQANETKNSKYATLIGHIGRTFEKEKEELNDPAAQSHNGGYAGKVLTLDENNERYEESRWCFDTPGVIQKDQILHLLTTDEIVKTLPQEMMKARAFLLKPNLSLFIAGLGRLDYIDGPERMRVVVFSSLQLPVSIVETDDAEDFYESFLGSEVMGVPLGGDERLAKWPKLEASYDEITVEGQEKHITACDVLLSSAGWIGINLPQGSTGKFKAWTPEKRGIYVRNPSLLPYGMNLRGKRVRRSLAYLIGRAFTYKKYK